MCQIYGYFAPSNKYPVDFIEHYRENPPETFLNRFLKLVEGRVNLRAFFRFITGIVIIYGSRKN